MTKINMTEWGRQIMSSPKRVAIPIMTHPGIELCGCSVLQAVTDGEIHAKAICALNERYPSAAPTAIMDLTVEAEAFGAKVMFADNEVPSVVGRLLTCYEDVKALDIPSLECGRVREYLKANKIAAENITDKPIFGGCIGPFSLAGRLYDMSELMMAIYIEPDTIKLLLDKCTEFITKYVQAMKETGVNGVILAEPAAGLVSNEDCSAFSSAYVKKIVEAVQDDYFMVVLHNCGNTGHCTAAMAEAGAGALHFGNQVEMLAAAAESPQDALIMGNIDPVAIMKMATPDVVHDSVAKLLKELEPYPGFVLSTGCDTPPGVPFENIDAFYAALDEYNATKM